MRLADLIRGLNGSCCRGGYHFVDFNISPISLLDCGVDCPFGHACHLGKATFRGGVIGDHRVGGVACGGDDIATGCGHARYDSSDSGLGHISQITPCL